MADITAPQPPSYGPPIGMTAPITTPPVKTRIKDLVFGWRATLAVLLAGIIVGGLVGAAITLIVDHSGNNTPARPTIGSGFGGFTPYGQGQSQQGQGSSGSSGS